MRRLQATEMSASVTRSPTRKVFVNRALFNTVNDFFISSMALSVAFGIQTGQYQIRALKHHKCSNHSSLGRWFTAYGVVEQRNILDYQYFRHKSRRQHGLTISILESGSSNLALSPGQVTSLCCILRQDTGRTSLHLGLVYRWQSEFNTRGSPMIEQNPFQVE